MFVNVHFTIILPGVNLRKSVSSNSVTPNNKLYFLHSTPRKAILPLGHKELKGVGKN